MEMPRKIEETKKLSREDMAFCLSPCPGTERVVFGSSDARLHEVDLAEENPEPVLFSGEHGHSSYVTGLARGRENLIVSGSYDRRLIWWNAETRKSEHSVKDAHGKWIRQVTASPDGSLVASVGDDMVCRLWEIEGGQLFRELKGGHAAETPHHYPSMLYTCAFSPDGELLATADRVGHIVIWNVADGRQIQTLEAPVMYTWDPEKRRHSIGGIRAIAFSPDGRQLAVGGIGEIGNIDHLGGPARLRLFDWKSGETEAELESSEVKGIVERIHYHPEGNWLLAMGGDHKGLALVVDTRTRKIVSEARTPANHAHDFAFTDARDGICVAGHHQVTAHHFVAG